MSFGTCIGFSFAKNLDLTELFAMMPGGVIIEVEDAEILKKAGAVILGETLSDKNIEINGEEIKISEILEAWETPLEGVFATKVDEQILDAENFSYINKANFRPPIRVPRPRVFVPIFPGTNCEFDTIREFERVGATCESVIFRNLSHENIKNSVDNFVRAIKNAQIIMIPGGFSGGDEPDGSGKFIATVFRNPRISEATMELLTTRGGLVLGVCNGFQALLKLGLLPFGEIRALDNDSPTLTHNKIGRHVSRIVRTRVASVKSPWLAGTEVDDVHSVAISHGEGRFVASDSVIKILAENGQIATQYVDFSGAATMKMPDNPNGSTHAIEGITDVSGRIFGKMGHSERVGNNIFRNVPGDFDQKIFASGVNYFK
jgi:phosphoribosylformylglycinamidine synthase